MKGMCWRSARPTKTAVRIELFGDEVEAIRYVDPTTGEILQSMDAVNIYPAKRFVTPKDRLDTAIREIRQELQDRLDFLNSEGKLLEAQRLEQRTKYDLEMLGQWATATAWRTMPAIWPAAGHAARC